MAKKTSRTARTDTPGRESARDHRPNRPQNKPPDRVKIPNVPLVALSAIGMAIAGYLTYTGWTGSHAAYCEAGGGCDIVQSSEWSKFLGVPTAFWGFLTYAAIAFTAARIDRASVQWKRTWVLGLLGLGVSIYLTAISVMVLGATCPYCLASLGIFAAIVGTLVWQRPPTIEKFAWRRWLLQTSAVALVAIAALHLQSSSNAAAGDEDPYLKGLAMRLTESGATFYGASWCPHCREQKAMFGASVVRLPYVECSPNGPQGPLAPSCISARVLTSPTWVFASGVRVTGVLTTQQLADRVGYTGPPGANGGKAKG
jgi:uncharacterized membrane protein